MLKSVLVALVLASALSQAPPELSFDSYFSMAESSLDAGNYAQAEGAILEAIKMRPESVDAHSLRARILSLQGRESEWKLESETVLNLSAKQAWQRLASDLDNTLKRSDPGEVEDGLWAFVRGYWSTEATGIGFRKRAPLEALRAFADVSLRLDYPTGGEFAGRHLKRRIADHPRDDVDLELLGKLEAKGWLDGAHRASGPDYQRWGRSYARTKESAERGNIEAMRMLAIGLHFPGAFDLEQQRPDEAHLWASVWEETGDPDALMFISDYWDGHEGRSAPMMCDVKPARDFKLAEFECRKAAGMGHAPALHQLGKFLLRIQQYRQVPFLTSVDDPCEMAKKSADFMRDAAEMGEWEACRDLALLLAYTPCDELRNGPDALRWARKAISLNEPGDKDCLEALASAYAAAGDFKSAVETLDRAAELLRKHYTDAKQAGLFAAESEFVVPKSISVARDRYLNNAPPSASLQSRLLLASYALALIQGEDPQLPSRDKRDGAEALRLAKYACQGQPHHLTLDVLAAAYSQVADFENAVRVQKKSNELRRSTDPEVAKALEAGLRSGMIYLDGYILHQPYLTLSAKAVPLQLLWDWTGGRGPRGYFDQYFP